MNMFIENGLFMNMFMDEPFINERVHSNRFFDEHVKYNSSSHPFRRQPAGVVAFFEACQAKIALNNRDVSFI